jgi:hypothetical protein
MDFSTKAMIGMGAMVLAWEIYATLSKHRTISQKIWQWSRVHPIKVSASVGLGMGALFGHLFLCGCG